MTATLLLIHLANLLAPAAVLAVLLPWMGRITASLYASKRPFPHTWWAQAAINFIAGALVTIAGLLLLGSDGKMMMYAALAVAMAGCQWWQLGGWRQ